MKRKVIPLPKNDQISKYIRLCIEKRQEWASSEDGYKKLGPGSPTVPGLQEYYQILAFVEGRTWPDR
jgi:hypothetical protein